MPNADNKFLLVQERLEIDKIIALPNIIVANHILFSLRNTASIYLSNAIRIASLQCDLDIDIDKDMIRYQVGHLSKAIEFIEYSILKN